MIHTVTGGDTLGKIANQYGLSVSDLVLLNPSLRANPDLIRLGDELKLTREASTVDDVGEPESIHNTIQGEADDSFRVLAGQLTFDAEGMEKPGKYFSRKPHVPGPLSGVTIGRGYDLKLRTEDEVAADMNSAGISAELITQFCQCVGMNGQRARNYLKANGFDQLLISPEQQKRLFNITYQEMVGDVIRICSKADVEAKYGVTQWNQIESLVRDILVDLRYRGDYTPLTRRLIQPCVVTQPVYQVDYDLVQAMSDKDYWVGRIGVPLDRFRRRKHYLSQ